MVKNKRYRKDNSEHVSLGEAILILGLIYLFLGVVFILWFFTRF